MDIYIYIYIHMDIYIYTYIYIYQIARLDPLLAQAPAMLLETPF